MEDNNSTGIKRNNDKEMSIRNEEKKDTEKRMEGFRKEVEKLIKKYNVGMQPEIKVTNLGITPGIVLIDLKNDESVVEHTDESKKVVIEPK